MVKNSLRLGSKTRYLVADRHRKSDLCSPRLLLNVLQSEHGWCSDIRPSGKIYLDNGSYWMGDSINHLEVVSPEFSTPHQVAVFDRANEQILHRAKANLTAQQADVDSYIMKSVHSFDLPGQASASQYEAYSSWLTIEAIASQLNPHLASRIPYAGAGFLSAHSSGMGFELSQSARIMAQPLGVENSHTRRILRSPTWGPEKAVAGWQSMTVISKDPQRSGFGTYLTYGVTGMLFMIMNAGHKIGGDVQLKDPRVAMRAFSLDAWGQTKVPLANGRLVSAIDIQRAYLRESQPHIESGEYPEWTYNLLRAWSETLDQLENDPQQLANKLDAYIKLKIFDHEVARARLTWATLRQALQSLIHMRRNSPESVISAVLNDDASRLDMEQTRLFKGLSKSEEVQRIGLESLRFAAQMQAADLDYHRLGGLYDQLVLAGSVDSATSLDEVQHAIHHPPLHGRTNARSKAIKKSHDRMQAGNRAHLENRLDEKSRHHRTTLR